MRSKQFVAYYRVSTSKQGLHGLGMEAQKDAVQKFLSTGTNELIAEFSEVETGKRTDRPELTKALALCRKAKATLLIAKLDRLARNAAFLLNLRDAGVDFTCCDMPNADRFTVGILALVAEREREMISERTKAGLAAAKRLGVKLGSRNALAALKLAVQANKRRTAAFADTLKPVVQEIRNAGVSTLRGIAECLNRRGYTTPLGKAWRRQSVAKLIARTM